MKILLLSVLAVAMIALLIPSAFSQYYDPYDLTTNPQCIQACFYAPEQASKACPCDEINQTYGTYSLETDPQCIQACFYSPAEASKVCPCDKINQTYGTYSLETDPQCIQACSLAPAEASKVCPCDKINQTYGTSENYDKFTIQEQNKIVEESKCGEGTTYKNGQCVLDERGGGCLIATAAFGSEMAPQVQFLREIRDNTVLQTQSGTTFMNGFNHFYYSFSPYVADYERENPVFKEAVKVTLTPLLTSLTLLNYVDIDSEEEMLGYGIGIILLNIGMYFVAPAVLIVSLKKRLFI